MRGIPDICVGDLKLVLRGNNKLTAVTFCKGTRRIKVTESDFRKLLTMGDIVLTKLNLIQNHIPPSSPHLAPPSPIVKNTQSHT